MISGQYHHLPYPSYYQQHQEYSIYPHAQEYHPTSNQCHHSYDLSQSEAQARENSGPHSPHPQYPQHQHQHQHHYCYGGVTPPARAFDSMYLSHSLKGNPSLHIRIVTHTTCLAVMGGYYGKAVL